jgi:hypothetical protein
MADNIPGDTLEDVPGKGGGVGKWSTQLIVGTLHG